MLHAKAVPAEGRKTEGPLPVACHVTKYSDGSGMIMLDTEVPSIDTMSEGTQIAFTQGQLWHWALQSNQQTRRVVGEAVGAVAVNARCVAEIKQGSGQLHAVQLLPRLTGKLASRASPQVGQIEPDEQFNKIAAAKVFLKVSELAGGDYHQLPDIGERVEFHLAPNPERSGKLWAAEVLPLENDSLAKQSTSRAVAPSLPEYSSLGASNDDGATYRSLGGGEQQAPPTLSNKLEQGYKSGTRVYIGRLPGDCGWRELQELFARFGNLVHVQLPLDDRGRRSGFGVVELETAEAVQFAVDSLQLAELKGQQVVVRDDDTVTNSQPTPRVFVGNLSPNTTVERLRALLDASGRAQIRVLTDPQFGSTYALIEFASGSGADAAVWSYHNSTLDGRQIFLRQVCDMSDRDGMEAQSRREAHAQSMGKLATVAGWIDAAAPLVDWGYSERAPSCWARADRDDGERVVALATARSSLLWAQVGARCRKLVTTRMDLSQLQGLYERNYNAKIEYKALGATNLREVIKDIPGLQLDSVGSRAFVEPAGAMGGSSQMGGGGPLYRRDDDDRRRDRDDRRRDDDRERDRDRRRDRDDRRRDDRRR